MQTRRKRTPAERTVFALDIGTRSVIGLVAVMREGKLVILEHERLEYAQRAMRDGQIEDITVVGKCIGQVRKCLEERLGIKLKKAAIAAAGRALQTRRVTIERKLNRSEVIDAEIIRLMEMTAIEQAQAEVMNAEAEGQRSFYCVGHTVIHYELDGYEMSEVLGHYGSVCQMTVIAAFLPRTVVESLYSAVEKSGLEVESLTLEPIAAMNLVIPQEVRMLNLALVDIGAGTSDIAISKAGEVIAYDMVTLAGDELTESLMKQYLVDFAAAEQIKRQMHDQETIRFTDILGMEQEISREEITQMMSASVDNLVAVVSNKILELNGTAPTALYLVGGGSMYVALAREFARRLQLDERRVTVGSGSWLAKLVADSDSFVSPDYVTPLGIALTAFMSQQFQFTAVTVNGKKVRQFRYEGLKVMDVLVLSGHYKYEQLAGRLGKRLRFELDGHVENIAGGLPKPAQIFLNDELVGLDALVHPGDAIRLIPAENGSDAQRTVGDLAPDLKQFTVSCDGKPCQAGQWLMRHGQMLSASEPIMEGDQLETVDRSTADQFAEVMGKSGCQCLLNGQMVSGDTLLQPDDQLIFLSKETAAEEAILAEAEPPGFPEASGAKQAEAVSLLSKDSQPPAAQMLQAAADATFDARITVTLNGRELILGPKENGDMPMLFDLFNDVDEEILSERKSQLQVLLNGQAQPFTTYLQDGDKVQIG